jgi:hypothetical protein
MTRIVAVYSDTPGSQLIRWGLGEKASHLAIEVGNLVFHSELKGVNSVPANAFWANHHWVDQAPISTRVDWDGFLQDRLQKIVKTPYDQPAFAFFAWRAALRKFAGVPFPKVNYLDSPKALICVEMVKAFDDAYAAVTGRKPVMEPGESFAIMSPLDAVAYAKKAWG